MVRRQALEGRGAAWSAKAAVKARQQARGDIMGPAASQVPLTPPRAQDMVAHAGATASAGDKRNHAGPPPAGGCALGQRSRPGNHDTTLPRESDGKQGTKLIWSGTRVQRYAA